jgi:hypothetical protein
VAAATSPELPEKVAPSSERKETPIYSTSPVKAGTEEKREEPKLAMSVSSLGESIGDIAAFLNKKENTDIIDY